MILLQVVSLKAEELTLTQAQVTRSNSLPSPLTLEYALNLATQNNPVTRLAENKLISAKAESRLIKSDVGVNLLLKARARWVESPSALQYLGREDHAAKVVLSKTIYDFGRTSNKVLASNENETVFVLQLKNESEIHRLRVMRAYFDVLLADLTYARDNEAMAMGYIRYDRDKERASLGQRSDLDVLEKQSLYEVTRQAKYESESQQRLTRNYLSLLIDRPDQLPSKLAMPSLEYQKLKMKEYEDLKIAALQNNLELKILKEKRSALMHQLKSIRAQRLPVVSAEVEAGVYEREIGSNDIWRAGVLFEMPLYQGGKVSASAAFKKNEIDQFNILIYQAEQEVKQNVLKHWLALGDLKIQTLASSVLYDYREYYLDRARALYEMEVKSDLGDSMVELSAASLKVAEAQFEVAMHWEMLAQLTQMTIAEMTTEELAQ